MYQTVGGIGSSIKIKGIQGECCDFSHIAVVHHHLLLHERICCSSRRVQLLHELGFILLHVILELTGTQRRLEDAGVADANRRPIHLG